MSMVAINYSCLINEDFKPGHFREHISLIISRLMVVTNMHCYAIASLRRRADFHLLRDFFGSQASMMARVNEDFRIQNGIKHRHYESSAQKNR